MRLERQFLEQRLLGDPKAHETARQLATESDRVVPVLEAQLEELKAIARELQDLGRDA